MICALDMPMMMIIIMTRVILRALRANFSYKLLSQMLSGWQRQHILPLTSALMEKKIIM